MTAVISHFKLFNAPLENQPQPGQLSPEEALSALADGQLEPAELERLLASAGTSAGAACSAQHPLADAAEITETAVTAESAMLERWSTYCLIGDALRAPAQAAKPADAAFLARFQQALAREAGQTAEPLASLVSSPAAASLPAASIPAISTSSRPTQAANDPVFRWKLVAGFASLTAVCAVAWQLVGQAGALAPQSGLLAQQQQLPSSSLLVATPAGAVLRDSRMQELLAAHRQLGGDAAVQMPGPFYRNAAFAVDAPGR